MEEQKIRRWPENHMEYLSDMERLEDSGIMAEVLAARDAYDPGSYSEADVREALRKESLSPKDFGALLSPAA